MESRTSKAALIKYQLVECFHLSQIISPFIIFALISFSFFLDRSAWPALRSCATSIRSLWRSCRIFCAARRWARRWERRWICCIRRSILLLIRSVRRLLTVVSGKKWQKTYSSQYSLVVTHPTTNWSLRRLSWLIGREADISSATSQKLHFRFDAVGPLLNVTS